MHQCAARWGFVIRQGTLCLLTHLLTDPSHGDMQQNELESIGRATPDILHEAV